MSSIFRMLPHVHRSPMRTVRSRATCCRLPFRDPEHPWQKRELDLPFLAYRSTCVQHRLAHHVGFACHYDAIGIDAVNSEFSNRPTEIMRRAEYLHPSNRAPTMLGSASSNAMTGCRWGA